MKRLFSIPPEKRTEILKKAVWIAAALFVLVFIVRIVVLRQVEEIPPWKLFPEQAFSFFSIQLDSDSRALSDLKEQIKKEALGPDTGMFKKAIFRLLFSSALPKQIIGVATMEDETGEPEFIFIVRMGRIVRFIKAFSGIFDRVLFEGLPYEEVNTKSGIVYKKTLGKKEQIRPSAYTILGNSIIAATSAPALESCIGNFTDEKEKTPGGVDLGTIFLRSSVKEDVFFFADNNSEDLTKIFNAIQDKYSFAAFPTIDAVSMILGYVGLLPGQVQGTILFYCSDSAQIRSVKSDVKFIYGAMRRKLKPSDIELKGDVLIEGKTVVFTFHVPDFNDAIMKKFNTEEGNTE
jgi:hypothetical protein